MFDTIGSDDPTIKTVQQQFEQWRGNRIKRGPIPEHLWDAAASICKNYPITNVSRNLRLSFAEPKKRVSTEGQTSGPVYGV